MIGYLIQAGSTFYLTFDIQFSAVHHLHSNGYHAWLRWCASKYG